MNTQAVNDNQVITKDFVDHFHQENERSRRDVGLDFYDKPNDWVKHNQTKDFKNNNIIDGKNFEINDTPINDNHVINKKNIDNELDKSTKVRLKDDSNDRYLQVHKQNIPYIIFYK